MKTKFIAADSKELIVFLTGWGCDDNQFKNMKSSKNLLICWDYSSLDFEFDFSPYSKVYLIAYSAGVFVAGLIKDKLPKLALTVAINGNPLTFDKYYGIPAEVLETFRGLNLDNYIEFRRKYLVASEEELADFNANSSMRSFESCFEELDSLKRLGVGEYPVLQFDKAIISCKDKIFDAERQKEYFAGKFLLLEDFAHNAFYFFNSFDDILKFCGI